MPMHPGSVCNWSYSVPVISWVKGLILQHCKPGSNPALGPYQNNWGQNGPNRPQCNGYFKLWLLLCHKWPSRQGATMDRHRQVLAGQAAALKRHDQVLTQILQIVQVASMPQLQHCWAPSGAPSHMAEPWLPAPKRYDGSPGDWCGFLTPSCLSSNPSPFPWNDPR